MGKKKKLVEKVKKDILKHGIKNYVRMMDKIALEDEHNNKF